MSGRPTADMAERLRYLAGSPYVPSEVEQEMNWAADRLAELDSEVATWHAVCDASGLPHDPATLVKHHRNNGSMIGTAQAMTEELRIDALLPPCPTCGGTHRLNVGEGHPAYGRCKVWTEDGYICPDCVDGKMSVEWCMAVVRAVFGPGWTDSEMHAIELLRAVKPT